MRVCSFDRWSAPDARCRGRQRAGRDGCAGFSALELLAQGSEEDLRRLSDEVRMRGRQRGGPVKAGALGGLLLEVEHVLEDLFVSLEPGKAVFLGLCSDLVAQFLDPLRGCLELSTDIRQSHARDSSRWLSRRS